MILVNYMVEKEEKVAVADYIIIIKNGGIFLKPRGSDGIQG